MRHAHGKIALLVVVVEAVAVVAAGVARVGGIVNDPAEEAPGGKMTGIELVFLFRQMDRPKG